MKKKNPIRAFIVILIIIGACVLIVHHFKITDFNTVSQEILYTSGQPRGMDYTRLLYKYHIKTIINLRSPAEHLEQNWFNEEITWVRTNGVNYFELPLDRNINSRRHFPDANMQEKFLSIMADKENLPVLVHDGKGESRVVIMAAVWLGKSEGYPPEQVLKIAQKIIYDRELAGQEIDFIRSLAK